MHNPQKHFTSMHCTLQKLKLKHSQNAMYLRKIKKIEIMHTALYLTNTKIPCTLYFMISLKSGQHSAHNAMHCASTILYKIVGAAYLKYTSEEL